MTAVTTVELLDRAARAGYGLGAFNVVHLETAEALVQASEQTELPLVLQISQNCVDYHGGLAPVARAMRELASAAATPIAMHLDHATREDLVYEAIDLGFDSVMFDGAAYPYRENLARTATVVSRAHAAGVSVEGELGEIGGKNGAHDCGARTDPDEAAEFVAETGVDALAVAVGSSHAMTETIARVDLDLISRLSCRVPVPLVLHGSSGVPDRDLRASITRGMTKINVSTRLNARFTYAVRTALAERPALVDSRRYLGEGRFAVVEEAQRILRVLAGRQE